MTSVGMKSRESFSVNPNSSSHEVKEAAQPPVSASSKVCVFFNKATVDLVLWLHQSCLRTKLSIGFVVEM